MWSKAMVDLLTNDVHNFNITVIIVLQNYFCSGKFGKTLIRNCQYRVFFYNRIEQLELRTISTQISTVPNFFSANFEYLYKTFPSNYSHYLLIDGQFKSTGADFWCRASVHAQRVCLFQPPEWFFQGRVARRLSIRHHGQLRRGLVPGNCPGCFRSAGQFARKRDRYRARPYAGRSALLCTPRPAASWVPWPRRARWAACSCCTRARNSGC